MILPTWPTSIELCEWALMLLCGINERQWEQRQFLKLLLIHSNWILLTVVTRRIKAFMDLEHIMDRMEDACQGILEVQDLFEELHLSSCLEKAMVRWNGVTWSGHQFVSDAALAQWIGSSFNFIRLNSWARRVITGLTESQTADARAGDLLITSHRYVNVVLFQSLPQALAESQLHVG